MPDIDPKQIPTLDDVVDQDAAKHHSPAESGIPASDNIESALESSKSESSEPESSEPESSDRTDQQADTEQTCSIEETDHERDEPDSQETGTDEAGIDETPVSYPRELSTTLAFSYQQPYAFLGNPVTKHSQISHAEESADTIIDADTLNEIIESTVKGLLPDLEQQLRFLIERALREKLPDELITNDDEQNDSTDQIN